MSEIVEVRNLSCDQIAASIEKCLARRDPLEAVFRHVNDLTVGNPLLDQYSVQLTRDLMRLEPMYGRIVWDIIRVVDRNHTLDKARKVSSYTYSPILDVLDMMVAQTAAV